MILCRLDYGHAHGWIVSCFVFLLNGMFYTCFGEGERDGDGPCGIHDVRRWVVWVCGKLKGPLVGGKRVYWVYGNNLQAIGWWS